VIIKENLELLFAEVEDIFVAGDLLWYPVEGSPKINKAPDVMVVFGRPKGRRGSYLQWQEENIVPQVVFEILSPSNTLTEMAEKLAFYERYGVEEYYLFNPDQVDLGGWLRRDEKLTVISPMNGWQSPRLGVRFELSTQQMQIYRPDGNRFLSFVELDVLRQPERERAERAEAQLQQERSLREQEQQRRQTLEAKLRELGIDPEQL
jgi:Uma2 family endonuclease